MKKLNLALFLFSVLLNTACKKNRPLCCVLREIPNEFVVANKDSTRINYKPGIYSSGKDTTKLFASSQNERLGLYFKYDGLKTYTLKPSDGFYNNITDQGTVVSAYKLDSTVVNKITVIYYDPKQNKIEGIFNLKFIKTFDNPVGSYPNSVSFLSGNFKVALHK